MVKDLSVRYKVAVQKFDNGKDSLHDCKCPSAHINHHEPHASSYRSSIAIRLANSSVARSKKSPIFVTCHLSLPG